MTATRVGLASPAGKTSDRFAARARAARWRGRRPVVIAVLVALAVVALGAFLLAGPVLVVRAVTVSGVSAQRAAEVRAAAAAAMGQPMARVDTRAMTARLEGIAFVASASVSRRWPSTLSIIVEERTPAVQVPDPAGGYRVVDSAGAAYAWTRVPLRGVPVVQVELAAASRPALVAALAVLAALPTSVRSTVGVVTAGSPDDVRLRIGKTSVIWGSPDRSDRKAAIYAVLRSTPARVYDLSSPDTPVLR